jgi:hypothetical protein
LLLVSFNGNNGKDDGNRDNDESVDGTVFAGKKNIERNNGKDFDIKDVFNDCQVGMFSK